MVQWEVATAVDEYEDASEAAATYDVQADSEALSRIAAGDLSAFEPLVNRYKDRLFRHIRRRVNDPHRAEDLTQEVFLRLFRAAQANGYSGRARVITWLFAIAGNCVTDHLRSEGRRNALRGATPPAESDRSPGPADLAEQREARQRIDELLATLPDAQREVVELKVLDGLTFGEIAEMLGCPIPTVKSRLVYGLKKLKECLDAKASGSES